jgi:hypothetical protein
LPPGSFLKEIVAPLLAHTGDTWATRELHTGCALLERDGAEWVGSRREWRSALVLIDGPGFLVALWAGTVTFLERDRLPEALPQVGLFLKNLS